MKTSINENIRELWSITSTNRNIQYDDIYSNTKDVLKAFRQTNEQRLQNNLISQGSFFSNIVKNSTLAFNSLWSSVHSKLPKNIFNFSLRYINNSLPTRKNLVKWGLSSSADCSFCFCPESLLHVISGCKTYLDEGRYTWRHDSVLNLIASSGLQPSRRRKVQNVCRSAWIY
jgi:small basic protein